MVTFVCESCNETLKKNQVEKHGNRCRQCHVTCVDCSRTFSLAEYGQHTSCVSEAEKYEKTLYKAKTNVKLNPQEAWMELITEAATRKQEAPANISEHLGRLSELDNVPRNCNKFTNFAKNSLRLNNNAIVDGIWKFLERLKNEKVQVAMTTVSNDEKKAEKDASGKKDPREHQGGKGEKQKVDEIQQKITIPDSTEDDAVDRNKRKQEKKQKKLDRLAAEAAAATEEAATAEIEDSAADTTANREKKSKKRKRDKILQEEGQEIEETGEEEKDEVKEKKKKKKDKKEKKQKA